MSTAAASPPNTLTKARVVRLVLIMAAITAALAAADVFLANIETDELGREAARVYASGMAELRAGHAEQALDPLRRAHSLARTNREYQLGLVDALIAVGKLDEGQVLLDDILQKDPNNGLANLVAARLMVKRGRTFDAEAYYHRAIYGVWSGDAATKQNAARVELIQFLSSTGQRRDLLAELLPLADEAEKDPQKEKQLAQWFMAAGSPARAAEVYQRLIAQKPHDAAAYQGLGEAELAMGRYRQAQYAFLNAFRRNPSDATARRRMEFSSEMAALDPTGRQLPSMEKYRRSLHLFEHVIPSLEQCVAKVPAPDGAPGLLEQAAQALEAKIPAHVTNEMAEAKLSLAEKMWQTRTRLCGASTSPAEEPLRVIMQKLEQQ